MNESTSPACAEFELGITQYAWGELAGELRPTVEAHLKQCTACRDLVSFVGELTESAREGGWRSDPPNEPHPDPSLIVDLEADRLDDERARKVSVHLLHCKPCREAYLLLRSLSNEHFEERILATDAAQGPWGQLVEHLKEFAIDLGRKYGPGALIGSVRIVSEQPAFAVRGGGLAQAPSKVLEMPVGENTYSIEVNMTEDGSISCDIAGLRTSLRAPLRISVRSGSGEEVISTESDDFGNTRFVVPSASHLDDLLLLTLTLKDSAQQILLRLPGNKKAT